MTKVNIIFDNNLDDTDVITMPDEIATKLDKIGQEFLDWVPSAEDEEYWAIIDGRKYLVAETDGFIKWLNARYCQENEKASVISRNTKFCPEYKSIEF